MSIFTKAFWRAASERAIKSAAQGAVLAGVGAVGFDALTASWQTIGGASLGAFLLSLLTSIGSDALTNGDGPSLTDAEVLAPEGGAVVATLTATDIGKAVGDALNGGFRDGATGRGRRG